ncbi:MAG: flagellar biosynthesis anti-sigma factor FlgM [Phycisphaerales bacterium]|nr:flagellar biosynthesis anti-sigma factor FlgM [Phycisphaerales bacterium]
MADIAPVCSGSCGIPSALDEGRRITPVEVMSGAPVRGQDKVEVSELASYLSKLRDMPAVRQDLVDRVKSEIAGGTYLTPEKLDAALAELAREL